MCSFRYTTASQFIQLLIPDPALGMVTWCYIVDAALTCLVLSADETTLVADDTLGRMLFFRLPEVGT